MAFRKWNKAGRPFFGPTFEDRKKCKKDVAAHLNKCRARQLRKVIQQRDELITPNHPNCFSSFHRAKIECSRLHLDDVIITDTKDLLDCWADHFHCIGKSQSIHNPALQTSEFRKTGPLNLRCSGDIPSETSGSISLEEMNCMFSFFYGQIRIEDVVVPFNWCWLVFIYTPLALPDLQAYLLTRENPYVLQAWNHYSSTQGKGQGSPAKKELQRSHPHLRDLKSVWDYSQREDKPCLGRYWSTPKYSNGVQKGCWMPRFNSCWKRIERPIHSGGDNVLTCFYDLASACDTVEFSVRLEEIFWIGIQGKCWRLIRDSYSGLTSQVRLGNWRSSHSLLAYPVAFARALCFPQHSLT